MFQDSADSKQLGQICVKSACSEKKFVFCDGRMSLQMHTQYSEDQSAESEACSEAFCIKRVKMMHEKSHYKVQSLQICDA